jgi:hypothetical protein
MSQQNAKLFLCRRNWDTPNPSPADECALLPFWFRGEGHTRCRERGLGESQFRRGDIHCGTLCIYVLCEFWLFRLIHVRQAVPLPIAS